VLSPAKARPSYPATALQSFRSDLKLVPSETKILDLAAGTGKFTELLVKEGYQVTAVEPVAEMRAKITEKLPTVNALEGTSWNIPVESESQDVVVIAQAFHWFDDIETLRECQRVLKPNGRLALIWNMESQERSKWVAKLRE
jgi:ubiquinone/menaquinone biosynthesis C-methylase UbiE